MGIIRTLDEQTVLRIAAGEVIDRPASVVRELVDNALDAQATEIEISLVDGGLTALEVADNGKGMEPDDLALCYHNHTTSKITTFEDLFSLSTLGFRGEALASIASVATLDIMSRPRNTLSGSRIVVSYGKPTPLQDVGMNYGTIVRVSELFERIPARKKFLQSPSQESKLVFRELIKKMIVFPQCGFLYRSDGREKFRTPPRHNHLERIIDLFGDISQELIPFAFEITNAKVSGFLAKPTYLKPQRTMQFFSVNRRIVEWKSFPFVIAQVYGNLIPPQKHPPLFIFVEMDGTEVDVNIHPMKREVRFRHEREFQESLWKGLHHALLTALMGTGHSQNTPQTSSPSESVYKESSASFFLFKDNPSPKEDVEIVEPDFSNFSVSQEPSLASSSGDLFASASSSPFEEYRYVGDLFATYLLLEKENEVLVVDQHAAHERIRYEEIKQALNQKHSTQELLSPLSLTLTADQYDEVFAHMPLFQSLGFEIEPFGGYSILIRSIPPLLSPSMAQEGFEACVEAITQGERFSLSELVDEAIKQMACKTAVRAHERLSPQEVRGLLSTLAKTPHATSCPHGRPTFLRFKRQDLEKLFKRTGF
ncbi:MAG: DNA mismatch repair endonuclease MutL [Brevinematales bacterium]|nr:DNA mismatch repair endonuclease MutL [Brevinematales bacterium]